MRRIHDKRGRRDFMVHVACWSSRDGIRWRKDAA